MGQVRTSVEERKDVPLRLSGTDGPTSDLRPPVAQDLVVVVEDNSGPHLRA